MIIKRDIVYSSLKNYMGLNYKYMELVNSIISIFFTFLLFGEYTLYTIRKEGNNIYILKSKPNDSKDLECSIDYESSEKIG